MTALAPIDLLVFGPHPDDIEIGLGGTVAKHVDQGFRVGLCDLTRGELGSNGTPDDRQREAQAAAEVLGVTWRHNLGWPDGAIGGARFEDDHVRAAAELVRACRPAVVALPYWSDRHPDHVAASRVVSTGVFRARLRRYPAEGTAWSADATCYYFINDVAEPSFVVDVTEAYERKRAALACHASQFRPAGDEAVETRLTGTSFLGMIEARDTWLGSRIGAGRAEGLVTKEPVVRESLCQR